MSAPARSIDATAMSISRCAITSLIGSRWTSTSNIDRSIVSGFIPCDIVRLPCGSRSMQSTRSPCSANATPRLSVVVVFATPPFWFASAITCVVAGAFAFAAWRRRGRGRRRATAIYALHSRRGDAFLHACSSTSRSAAAAPPPPWPSRARSRSRAAPPRPRPRRRPRRLAHVARASPTSSPQLVEQQRRRAPRRSSSSRIRSAARARRVRFVHRFDGSRGTCDVSVPTS